MGLCLGHDLLLQKKLQSDFTTFVVKDRVLKHNPLLALSEKNITEDAFLEGLGNDFKLIKVEDLKLKLQEGRSPDDFYLLDLRASEAYMKDGLAGSITVHSKRCQSVTKRCYPIRVKRSSSTATAGFSPSMR